jgi:hypothetical protein
MYFLWELDIPIELGWVSNNTERWIMYRIVAFLLKFRIHLSGPIRSTCFTRVIHFDFITNNISRKEQIIRHFIRHILFSTASHLRPNILFGLSNGYRGFLSRGYSGWGVKLTTYFHLVARWRKHGAISLLPICLHGAYLNYAIEKLAALFHPIPTPPEFIPFP